MDSSVFFFTSVIAAAIGLLIFTLFRNLRFYREDNKENNTSASSPSSPPQTSLSSSSSLNRIWTHHVFPSFRGEDVRRDFLSHIQAEFQRKGITPFIDNEIKRGESIGPELIRVIRGSKIAIILLSRNYASSSWCLDELSEILKCRKELGQIVMVVFHNVDPSDVKKLTGYFGKVFKKTCAGKSKEDIGRWTQALTEVATIAGYHSNNWDNEAAMINKIATDISNKLNNSLPSRDFDGFVGMRAHLEKMKKLLCLDSDEVRMVGIWGPSGIGKSTIARAVYNELCNSFPMSVFMESIEGKYTRPCSDDYSAKLRLQQHFMSKITNEKDMEVSHLGVVEDRLKDKKVLVVLDGVDQSIQLDAMAKETWFGPGSRIIITTQNQKLFREHRINQIYEVDFPPNGEALQILCMYAFSQKSPKDGFLQLAREVIRLANNLPLGLRVMGSYLRGMSKQEWTKAITRLRASLDTNIQSILKLSYEALDDQDKDLFLYIACFFNIAKVEKVEAYLKDSFSDVRHGIDVLTEKSLISIDQWGCIRMHNLLAQQGKDIVRKQHIREPGQRLFLTESRDFLKVLKDDAAGSKSVIGINVNLSSIEGNFHINERAFEGMNNLQFLRFSSYSEEMYDLHFLRIRELFKENLLQLPPVPDYIPQNLRLLEWWYFPMTCLPSSFKTDFLVTLQMPYSKLKKLWKGNKPLGNLKWMDLRDSQNLTELPDLSTATSLQELDLSYCSSLINLPSIGNATNLQKLDLSYCSSLVKIPFSFGNLHKLQSLNIRGCSKLEVLPININLESLHTLDLTNCLLLKRFPEILTNVSVLKLERTEIKEIPSSIKSWSRLNENNNSASSSSLSPLQSSFTPSSPPSSFNHIWTHPVFSSFHGPDVRSGFLSHFFKELQSKGITPVDHEIENYTTSRIIEAIRGSKIAIILLSQNYASSSWCLEELVEIMESQKNLNQTVMVVFHGVDPSDVKKLTGDFGKVFEKTCAGKSKEDIGRWKQALVKVATIVGYHSNKWVNEAEIINQIATDIRNELNSSTLVGMEAHQEKIERLLSLNSDEVRMIGMWGPSGIEKTTIASVVYEQLYNSLK